RTGPHRSRHDLRSDHWKCAGHWQDAISEQHDSKRKPDLGKAAEVSRNRPNSADLSLQQRRKELLRYSQLSLHYPGLDQSSELYCARRLQHVAEVAVVLPL